MLIRFVLFFSLCWSLSATSAEIPEAPVGKIEDAIELTVDRKIAQRLADIAKLLPGEYQWNYPIGYDTLTIQWAVVAVDGKILGGGRHRSSLYPQFPTGWPFNVTVDPSDPSLIVIQSQLEKAHVMRLSITRGGQYLTGKSIGGNDAEYRRLRK